MIWKKALLSDQNLRASYKHAVNLYIRVIFFESTQQCLNS